MRLHNIPNLPRYRAFTDDLPSDNMTEIGTLLLCIALKQNSEMISLSFIKPHTIPRNTYVPTSPHSPSLKLSPALNQDQSQPSTQPSLFKPSYQVSLTSLLRSPLPHPRQPKPQPKNHHKQRQNNRLQNLDPLTLRNRPHRKRENRRS